ncbi:MAG: SDR family oxidoreductase, partial [Pseudomonadota bacterium]
GQPGMAVYSATKAALRSVARTLSAELGARGVRVNSVAPGPIETPIYQKLGMSEADLAEMGQGIVAQVPAGRFGAPAEIAAAVAFLASDGSSYMRGAEMPVDGGWSNL